MITDDIKKAQEFCTDPSVGGLGALEQPYYASNDNIIEIINFAL